MPELPEVAEFVRVLRDNAVGQVVRRVDIADPRMAEAPPGALRAALVGRRLARADRLGKWAFLGPADGALLAIHFGMTGRPVALRPGAEPPRHVRLALEFRDGSAIAIDDPRRFGAFALAESVEAFARDRRLGVDALTCRVDDVAAALAGRRAPLKAAILDQSGLAGVGNLYADEALWRARMDPRVPAGRLDRAAVRVLHRAIREVLETAVRKRAEYDDYPRGWLLHVREGPDCPRCGGGLRRATVGGRTTVWCAPCVRAV